VRVTSEDSRGEETAIAIAPVSGAVPTDTGSLPTRQAGGSRAPSPARPAPAKPPLRRCALYTRKSSEEGLDQAFNSLDAQREAAAAFVKSQSGEGWRAVDTLYDDGGYSGGSMERPALQRLLADIALGRIDVVVVYKIDRLTRSLADFARMVELFDRHGVSFVSVTQAFNTTSSMGRLTLNVLLSFAQFEREVTGERIRDKIAASKARGMWMGGALPLGYDAPLPGSRALTVNEGEAETVRLIFRTYLELSSVHELARWLEARGILSKARLTRKGRALGGLPFSRGALFHLLQNRTYRGMILHRDQAHPGQHAAIVEEELFDAVAARLAHNRRTGPNRPGRGMAPSPLTGRLFDAGGHPLSPTWSKGQRGTLYRYYVSAPLQQGKRRAAQAEPLLRVPASKLEARIAEVMERLAVPASGDRGAESVVGTTSTTSSTSVSSDERFIAVKRVDLGAETLRITLTGHDLEAVEARLQEGERVIVDDRDPELLHLTLPFALRRRGGETEIRTGGAPLRRADPVLVRAQRAARVMVGRDPSGLPWVDASPPNPYRRALIRLAFLAPDIQRAILAGAEAPDLDLAQLLDRPIPLDWQEQRRHYLR
jgi:site-specific DNA recombinase